MCGRSLTSRAGYTLIELMIVLAILGVLVSMCVPSLKGAHENYRINTAGSAIATKLTEARTQALKRNRQTQVVIDATTRKVQVQTDGGVDVGTPEFLMEGIGFEGLSGTTDQILFDPLGRPVTPKAIRIRYRASALSRTIRVATTGRITVDPS